MNNLTANPARIFPVKVVARTFPYDSAFSEGALRALIFRADDRKDKRGQTIPGNGLAAAGAIIRVGRRVLINLDKFDIWLASSQGANR